MAIGIASSCKVNANIGNVGGDVERRGGAREARALHEVRRRHGDGPLDRRRHRRHPPGDHRRARVPIGTVPIYQALQEVRTPEELTPEILLDMLEHQAQAGRRLLHDPRGRPARAPPARQRPHHGHRLARRLDHGAVDDQAPQAEPVLHALGQGPRDLPQVRRLAVARRRACGPAASTTRATRAQFAELETLGELTRRAWEKDVQVMIEGPGPRAVRPDRDERGEADGGLPRGAVLRARPARHRHRARLRPHHERDRRDDGRLRRRGDALLRDAEGAPRAARTRRT